MESKLSNAYLQGSNLKAVSLEKSDLRHAKLLNTNLFGASLRGADLEWADLEGANLEGAELAEANLKAVNLRQIRHNDYTIWPSKKEKLIEVRNLPEDLKLKLILSKKPAIWLILRNHDCIAGLLLLSNLS